jgi:hypothetical protein
MIYVSRCSSDDILSSSSIVPDRASFCSHETSTNARTTRRTQEELLNPTLGHAMDNRGDGEEILNNHDDDDEGRL